MNDTIEEMDTRGELEWVPDADWSTASWHIDGKRCRWGTCQEPAVAALFRGAKGRWWAYCGKHLYSRRLVDGMVLRWRRRT